MKLKHILLVGGAGYIGTSVTEHLLSKGLKITCLDSLLYAQKNSIKKFKSNKNYNFFLGDIREKKSYKNILKNVDVVIILAGLVGDPITKKYRQLSNSINLSGMKKFILACKKTKKLDRLIFISTCSNYGLSRKKNIIFKENSPLKPLSIYAKQKVEIEKFLLSFRKSENFKPCILRFATAFGLSPRMRFDLTVNHFTKSIFENKELEIYDAETWRPYCHVKDFARLIYIAITCKSKKIAFQVFNAGSSKNNFRKIDIINKIKKILFVRNIVFKKNDIDQRNYKVNFEKVKKVLKFKTKFSLEYGIKEIQRAIKKKKFKISKSQLGNYYIQNN
ncbi:MAG: SDR family oxidoreductase [Pelagibacteraceae bacterium]|jgi:nucleoside-diphosphate-sugar epimerase|nr:SDR family oxidoreductase [Pelagibacteraceae bacterium]